MPMLSLPITFSSVIGVFVPVFSRPVWQHVKVLMTGAVLAPGKRTVTAILQIMGRSAAPDFQTYHRVLNRAVWSPLTASRLLLRLLVAVFIPSGVVVFGLDDTIERRRGDQITAKGIYRDPVRSSHASVVKVSGLRWLGCMLLTPYSQNIRTRVPTGVYAPTIARTSACLPYHAHRYSLSIWTVQAAGERQWTGNTCWRLSRGPLIRSCWSAMNTL